MKNMYILYSIAIFAIVGVLVCCVSYTSGTASTDTPQRLANTDKPKTLKKKPCACCDEKQERMREMMRQWINEKPQKKSLNKEVSVTIANPER